MTADCSGAGGAEHSVAGGAESFVIQDVECSVAGGTEGSVAGGAEYCGGTFLVGSTYHHLHLLHTLPCSFKWGNVVPGAFLCSLLRHHHGMGDCCNLGRLFCFDDGNRHGSWSRGNWPVFSCLK